MVASIPRECIFELKTNILKSTRKAWSRGGFPNYDPKCRSHKRKIYKFDYIRILIDPFIIYLKRQPTDMPKKFATLITLKTLIYLLC